MSSFAATEARFHAKLANQALKRRDAAMSAARASKALGDMEQVAQWVGAARNNNRQALESRRQRATYRAKMVG